MKDEKAQFCDNIRLYQDLMYRIGFSILRNDEDTKDAVQESILKAFEHIESLKDNKKFKAWILKILTNTSYEMIRKRKDVLELTDEISENNSSIEDRLCNKITVLDIISNLDVKYREVIVLYYYEDMSIKEISQLMNLTEDNVKKRLSRGREKLKKFLCCEEENYGQ